MFDVKTIREDFPMIKNNPDLIYFDNGATTFKPNQVIDSVVNYYQNYNSNIGRGDYNIAARAEKEYENTRKKVAEMINCIDKEVSFFSNITACLNQIVYGLSKDLKKGDVVLLSMGEHASNLLPWYREMDSKGIVIKYVPIDFQGNLIIDEFKKMLNKDVKLISLAYVGNVLGSIMPIKQICSLAHEYDIKVIVDAAQAIGHLKIDVKDLDVDFLCFSAHKMLGPDGVGVLYGKYELLNSLDPIFLGGGMNARFDHLGNVILKEAPYKFEAGTPNIEGVIGLGKACEYLMNIGLDNIHEYERKLRAYCLDKMLKLDNIIIFNPDNIYGPITFNVKDIFAQDSASYLASKNIAVRSGNHCAKILHNIIDTDQSIRASLYLYNNEDEVDRFVEEVSKININSVIDIFL